MTGFGRAEAEKNGYKITVEIKSVNHRFLDMSIKLPRFMLAMEDGVRAAVKQKLTRGRVEVFINYASVGSGDKRLVVDEAMVKNYLEAAAAIKKIARLKDDLTLARMMTLNDVLSSEEAERDDDLIASLLGEAANGALDALITARAAEGERISADILDRAEQLSVLLDSIEAREPAVAEEYAAKLRAKLDEHLAEADIDQNRFIAELLYFTDRASITEEIVRLRSHFVQLKETLAQKEAAGRSLDFLVQELNREFNTIGSKSGDVTITKAVIAAKSEVEKIREQIQNLE